jgi:hypothetical protein
VASISLLLMSAYGGNNSAPAMSANVMQAPDGCNTIQPCTAAAEAVTRDSLDNKLSRRGDAADDRGALARWQNMD